MGEYSAVRKTSADSMSDPCRLVACAECRTLTREDCLDDLSGLVALAGKCCESCAAELVHEAHAELDDDDSEPCSCSYCVAGRARIESVRRAAEARVRGGVTMAGLRLVSMDNNIEVE